MKKFKKKIELHCICPENCDCQKPYGENQLISNSCSVHNENPDPDPSCLWSGFHKNGSIDDRWLRKNGYTKTTKTN